MRKGWEYKRFTDVCDVTYGYAFDSKCFTDNPEDTPLIRIRDVKRGFSETFYNGEIPDGYTVMEGDYLVGMDGEFNIGQWGKRPGVLNQRVCKMNSSSSELINQYMYYFMKVCLKSIEDETPFVTVKHLSAKRINQIQIPLPPLSTQLSIVSELDKINELIRLKKEQLKDFDNLAQSLFYEMFGDPLENERGWEVKKISNIAKYHNGVAHEQDIDKDGDFVLINAKFISSEGQIKKYTSIQRFPLFKNDIVMVLSDLPNGKSLAKCFLIDEDNKYTLNQRICCFRGFDGSSIYLKNIINRNPYLLSFDNGKGQTNLRKGDVEKIPIPLPPLPLQHLFAQRIEQIEHQKAEVQKSITDLETLLASRMQYWFE